MVKGEMRGGELYFPTEPSHCYDRLLYLYFRRATRLASINIDVDI